MLGAVSGLYNMEGKYQAQLEAFRKSDSERDRLVQELLEQYAKLQADYSDKCNDYENERASRKMWQDKERASSQALAAARQDASPFVVALIDGDGAIVRCPYQSFAIVSDAMEPVRNEAANLYNDGSTAKPQPLVSKVADFRTSEAVPMRSEPLQEPPLLPSLR
ncbi:hypothetical protein LTR66_007707 [Elasticomyces elasticus]|nr:hypothetical protein LTR66_007707 [Elasticomyces elasticus]